MEKRTPEELGKAEFNYFIALNLSITETNKAVIEKAINKLLGNPSGDLLTRRLIALRDDIKETLLTDVKKRKEEAERAKKFKLDEIMLLVQSTCLSNGMLFKSELTDLCNAANKNAKYFEFADLEKRFLEFNKGGAVKYIDNTTNVIPFAKFDKVTTLLEAPPARESLYEFLGISPTASVKEIESARKTVYDEAQKKSDLKVKQAASNLCSEAQEILLKDPAVRKQYDYYIKVRSKVWNQFKLRKTYGAKGMSLKEYYDFAEILRRELGLGIDEVEDMLGAGLKYYNLVVSGSDADSETKGKLGIKDLELCPYDDCGKVYENGAKVCPHCGRPLEVVCWNCSGNMPFTTKSKTCPTCGASYLAEKRFNELVAQAEKVFKTKGVQLVQLEAAIAALKNVVGNYKAFPQSFVFNKIAEFEAKLNAHRIVCWNCNKPISTEGVPVCPNCSAKLQSGKQELDRLIINFDTLLSKKGTRVSGLKRKIEEVRRSNTWATNTKKALTVGTYASEELAKCETEAKKFAVKKKGKRAALISSLSVVCLALLCLGFVFFTYWLPWMQYPLTVEEVEENKYTVTGAKDNNVEVLEIDSLVPKFIFTNDKVVVSVAAKAFQGNSNLKKVIVPESVKAIGRDAFSNCSSLEQVTLSSATPLALASGAFAKTDAQFLVPISAYEKYLTATNWSAYRDRIFPDYGNEDGYGCILFDSADGSGVAAIKTHRLDTAYPQLPTPQKKGYDFAGWKNIDNGKIVESGVTVMAQNTKLLAVWKAKTYQIVYQTNGGILPLDAKTNYTIESKTIALPIPQRKGFTFGGWFENSDFSGVVQEQIDAGSTGNKTYYAKWGPYTYQIAYNTNGGTLPFDAKITYTVESETFSLPIPQKQGYTFKGWFEDAEFGGVAQTQIEAGSTGDKTYYAKWTPVIYQIVYQTNGGTLSSGVKINYTIESDIIALPIPQKQGYTFGGWFENSDFSGVKQEQIEAGSTGDKTYYAKWTPYTYQFEFESYGGTLIQGKSEQFGGTLTTETPMAPASGEFSAGYMFAGWSLSQNGSQTNGLEIDIIKWEKIPFLGANNTTVRLYAVWVATPTNWFSFENVGDTLLLGGLTPEWENYAGSLNKFSLALPSVYGAGSVQGIKASAFEGRTQLVRVSIPKTYTAIGAAAFRGCTSLADVAGGANVTRVDSFAFENTPWYKNRLDAKSFFLTLGKTAVKYDPAGGTSITTSFFSTSVTSLGARLFEGLSGSDGSVALPTRIKYVGERAFANSAFTKFTLPSAATYGENAFEGVTLTSVNLSSSKANLDSIFGAGAQIETLTFATVYFDGKLELKGSAKITTVSAGFAQTAKSDRFTSVELNGLAGIDNFLLYNNNISSLTLGSVPIGTLNLTNNQLILLDLTGNNVAKLMLAGNQITSITCSKVNEALKIIFMPADTNQLYNKLRSLAFTQFTPNLVSLDVANNNVTDLKGVSNLTKLKELYLGGNPVLEIESQLVTLDTETFCEQLDRLNLGDAKCKNTVLSIVKKCKNLTWLQLYNTGITSKDLTDTISQSTHGKLVYLKISHNGLNSVPASLGYIKTVVIEYEDYRQENVSK